MKHRTGETAPFFGAGGTVLHLSWAARGTIAVCFLAVPLFVRTSFTPWMPVDDVGITLRYARNFVHGHGIIYNPGSDDIPVQGCSTPGWFLITSVFALCSWNRDALLHITVLAALICQILTCLGMIRLMRGLGRERGSWLSLACGLLACVYYLYDLDMIFNLGMETALWMACSLWSVILFTSRATRRAGIAVMMVGSLVRFEFAVLAAVLFVYSWAVNNSRRFSLRMTVQEFLEGFPLKWGLLYSAPVLIWIGFSQWYFGSPLPWPLHAKLQDSASAGHFGNLVNHGRAALRSPLVIFVSPLFLVGAWRAVVMRRRGRPNSLLFLLLVWSVVYALVDFLLLGATAYCPWYRAPITLVYALLAGYGALETGAWCLGRAARYRGTRLRRKAVLALTGAVALYLCLILAAECRVTVQAFALHELHGIYRDIAEYLNENDPQAKVRMDSIGHCGYFFDGYVADAMCIVMGQLEGCAAPVDYLVVKVKERNEAPPTADAKWFYRESGGGWAAFWLVPCGDREKRGARRSPDSLRFPLEHSS